MKTAQTRVGHADVRVLLGIYAQATTEADRQAAERLADRFMCPTPDECGRTWDDSPVDMTGPW